MKRWISAAAVFVLVAALTSPAGAQKNSTSSLTYALAGEARALDLALGGQGLTLGVALSQADSKPSAMGVGAGQCSALGDEPEPDNLPCNESTTQTTNHPGEGGEAGTQVCAAPALPAPLDTILKIDTACGSSHSGVKKGSPFTTNSGKIAELSAGLNVAGVLPQLEDAKDQVVDVIRGIADQVPVEEVKNAVNQLLDVLDEGQAVQVILGPSSSNIRGSGTNLVVTSTAAGAKVGILGIPDLDGDGLPIPGTSRATEDGLVIIEVGAANAEALVSKTKATADATAEAALVTVRIRDITKTEPTYVSQSLAPGQSMTILEGTPAESTITAAAASTEVKGRSAVAASDAVRLHLLKGVQGGIILGLGRTTAAANVAQVLKAVEKRPPTKVLPVTGGTDRTPIAIAILVAAAGILVLRRRFSH